VRSARWGQRRHGFCRVEALGAVPRRAGRPPARRPHRPRADRRTGVEQGSARRDAGAGAAVGRGAVRHPVPVRRGGRSRPGPDEPRGPTTRPRPASRAVQVSTGVQPYLLRQYCLVQGSGEVRVQPNAERSAQGRRLPGRSSLPRTANTVRVQFGPWSRARCHGNGPRHPGSPRVWSPVTRPRVRRKATLGWPRSIDPRVGWNGSPIRAAASTVEASTSPPPLGQVMVVHRRGAAGLASHARPAAAAASTTSDVNRAHTG